VRDMRSKLDSLAVGTDSFAAAMQEVAASSEEQSASTEEIAAAASTLAGAADRLSRLIANLRLDDRQATDETPVAGPVLMPTEITLGRAIRPAIGTKVG
jgi:ABC-type transporter Mla subunit MlaD